MGRKRRKLPNKFETASLDDNLEKSEEELLKSSGLPIHFGNFRTQEDLPKDIQSYPSAELLYSSEPEEVINLPAPSRRKCKKSKQLTFSQLEVCAEEMSVRQLLAYYPHGLNYHLDNGNFPAQTHIKFDEDGLPIAFFSNPNDISSLNEPKGPSNKGSNFDLGIVNGADKGDEKNCPSIVLGLDPIEKKGNDQSNDDAAHPYFLPSKAELIKVPSQSESTVSNNATGVASADLILGTEPCNLDKSKKRSIKDDDCMGNDRILKKYFRQRYDLFYRFDEGVLLDQEGWFSVTPEAIAVYIAQKVAESTGTAGVVWDAFAGVGGNAIQFAMGGMHVVGTDIDKGRLVMAQHNANIYGVSQYIDFIQADALKMDRIWRRPRIGSCFEATFLSPPWGGPGYIRATPFNPLTMLPLDGTRMTRVAQECSEYILFYLPKNTDITSLVQLFPLDTQLCIERHFLADQLKVVIVHVHQTSNRL